MRNLLPLFGFLLACTLPIVAAPDDPVTGAAELRGSDARPAPLPVAARITCAAKETASAVWRATLCTGSAQQQIVLVVVPGAGYDSAVWRYAGRSLGDQEALAAGSFVDMLTRAGYAMLLLDYATPDAMPPPAQEEEGARPPEPVLDGDALSIDRLAQAIEVEVRALPFKRVVLVGHQQGGAVVTRVRGPWPRALFGFGHALTWPVLPVVMEPTLATGPWINLDAVAPLRRFLGFSNQLPVDAAADIRYLARFTPRAALRELRELVADPTKTGSQQVPTHVLVLTGADDVWYPTAEGEERRWQPGVLTQTTIPGPGAFLSLAESRASAAKALLAWEVAQPR